MKRLIKQPLAVLAALSLGACGSIGAPIATDRAKANSDGWTSVVAISKSSLRSGSSLAATVTVINRTGRTVDVLGCPSDSIFTAQLGNAKIPNRAIISDVLCRSPLHPGKNVFHFSVAASYDSCGVFGTPVCARNGVQAKLPVGTYQLNVSWPLTTPSIPKPKTLSVSVTK